MIRGYLQQVDPLVQHLAVLRRHADDGLEVVVCRLSLQFTDHRGQFDGLRACAEYGQGFQEERVGI